MGQVTGQALEVGGDGALELVFHVNAHPLVHVAGEGWESAESWALCQDILEASLELLIIHPVFPPPRAEPAQTRSLLAASSLHLYLLTFWVRGGATVGMRVQESSQVGWVSGDMVAEGLGRLDGILKPT